MSLMTKLTLTLTDLHDASVDPNRIRNFHLWDWNFQMSIDSQHANCWHSWGLYDIEVVRCIVYLNLRAFWITWLAVP